MRAFLKMRADPEGERGATVVIVALSLIAMMGMVVLVVDVGGLLWKRRELVNGSDAAALSAASTCALKSTVDPRTAEQAADQLAAENVTGLDPSTATNATVASGACHSTNSGWVKVQYSQQQHLYFAPVLGFSNQNPVTTKATAIWGPPGTSASVPIAIYTSSFQSNCDITLTPPPPHCYFWFDNNGFGTSRFGLLDLNPSPAGGWDVPADQQQCPNVGKSTLQGWIDGSNGTYTVSGDHVYLHPASLPLQVTVTDPAGGTATSVETTTVTAAPITRGDDQTGLMPTSIPPRRDMASATWASEKTWG